VHELSFFVGVTLPAFPHHRFCPPQLARCIMLTCTGGGGGLYIAYRLGCCCCCCHFVVSFVCYFPFRKARKTARKRERNEQTNKRSKRNSTKRL